MQYGLEYYWAIQLILYKIISFQLFTKRQNFTPVHNESIFGRQKNVNQKLKFDLVKVQNIVGKGENAGTSIFSISYNVFKGLIF